MDMTNMFSIPTEVSFWFQKYFIDFTITYNSKLESFLI